MGRVHPAGDSDSNRMKLVPFHVVAAQSSSAASENVSQKEDAFAKNAGHRGARRVFREQFRKLLIGLYASPVDFLETVMDQCYELFQFCHEPGPISNDTVFQPAGGRPSRRRAAIVKNLSSVKQKYLAKIVPRLMMANAAPTLLCAARTACAAERNRGIGCQSTLKTEF